jgi:hypothetical protein
MLVFVSEKPLNVALYFKDFDSSFWIRAWSETHSTLHSNFVIHMRIYEYLRIYYPYGQSRPIMKAPTHDIAQTGEAAALIRPEVRDMCFSPTES